MVLTSFIALTALVVGYRTGHKRASKMPEEWPVTDHGHFVSTGDAGSL
jgi:hypothetical protein